MSCCGQQSQLPLVVCVWRGGCNAATLDAACCFPPLAWWLLQVETEPYPVIYDRDFMIVPSYVMPERPEQTFGPAVETVCIAEATALQIAWYQASPAATNTHLLTITGDCSMCIENWLFVD